MIIGDARTFAHASINVVVAGARSTIVARHFIIVLEVKLELALRTTPVRLVELSLDRFLSI